MTRSEFKKFLRATLATLIAGLLTWTMAKLGFHITAQPPSLP